MKITRNSKILLPLVTTLVMVFIIELVIRQNVHLLPSNLLVYLHNDMKTAHPEVTREIETRNPWVRRRHVDEDMGWTFVRDKNYSGINEDNEKYDRTTSSIGFITPDEPGISTRQLVTLGDSFLSTFYVTEPIPWVIRNELQIPVFNIAVAGWGPYNYRNGYKKYACSRNARFVAVFTFPNDIDDVQLFRNWNKNGDRLPFFEWVWRRDMSITLVNKGDSWLDKNSILWNWIKLAYHILDVSVINQELHEKPVLQKLHVTHEFKFQDTNTSYNMKLVFPQLFTEYTPEDLLPGGKNWVEVQQYINELNSLKSLIESCGSKMLLISIPAKERIYLSLMPENKRRQYIKHNSHRIDGFESVLAWYSAKTNTPYMDLSAPITFHTQRGRKLYFTRDGHLNSEGNMLVGKLASMFINMNRP